MPMIEAETVKAVQQLLQRRGIQQHSNEPLGDYVARGLRVSAGKAAAFLDALHNGSTIEEARRTAGIHDARMLFRISRAAGVTLGRISRHVNPPQVTSVEPPSALGATENQVSMSGQVPQRINPAGTKVEDLAGVGKHDSQGG